MSRRDDLRGLVDELAALLDEGRLLVALRPAPGWVYRQREEGFAELAEAALTLARRAVDEL